MKTMKDLKEKVKKEIEELAQKENFTAGDLETLYKLTCVKKNILTAEAMEMESEGGEEEGYSQRGDGRGGRGGYSREGGGGGYSNEGGGYSYDEGGNSYRRGGRRSRDAMGRFTRRYSRDSGGYSNGGGYSYHDGSEEMAEMMEDMMEDLPPDERHAAMKLLKRMRG